MSDGREGRMTTEEMREHEWDVPWSGGKDSTATILLMLENGIPIRQVKHVRMMWNDETPATLPAMVNFVDEAAEKLRQMGLKVVIRPSVKTAVTLATARFSQTKDEYKIGKQYGWMAFIRGQCKFQGVKERTSKTDAGKYQMLGYAADETSRLHRLGGKTQSILQTLAIAEADCYSICDNAGMLSPHYKAAERDGCWFCPNCRKEERVRLRRESPGLYREIEWLTSITQCKVDGLVDRNNWLKDYARAHPDDWRWRDWKGNKPKGWIDGQTEMEGL